VKLSLKVSLLKLSLKVSLLKVSLKVSLLKLSLKVSLKLSLKVSLLQFVECARGCTESKMKARREAENKKGIDDKREAGNKRKEAESKRFPPPPVN